MMEIVLTLMRMIYVDHADDDDDNTDFILILRRTFLRADEAERYLDAHLEQVGDFQR